MENKKQYENTFNKQVRLVDLWVWISLLYKIMQEK